MNTSFRASQIKTPACVGVFFRPGVLTVSGRGSIQVCVQVPPDPLQKILKAPPDKLHRSSGETVVQRVTLDSKQACGSTGVTHKLPPQLGRCPTTEPDLLIGFSGGCMGGCMDESGSGKPIVKALPQSLALRSNISSGKGIKW